MNVYFRAFAWNGHERTQASRTAKKKQRSPAGRFRPTVVIRRTSENEPTFGNTRFCARPLSHMTVLSVRKKTVSVQSEKAAVTLISLLSAGSRTKTVRTKSSRVRKSPKAQITLGRTVTTPHGRYPWSYVPRAKFGNDRVRPWPRRQIVSFVRV